MSSTTTQVLREYLVSLGYRVDGGSERKFDLSLDKAGKWAFSAASAVVGVGIAAQTMVTLFARSMERMYYESRLAQSTVGNLQAVDFAARSIGLSGEEVVNTIKNVARSLRLNPGLRNLAESLGIETKDGKRDMAEVAKDLVTQLAKMEPYIGAQYANLFGIDPDTLLLWGENIAKYEAMLDKRKAMNAEAGIDPEAAAAASIKLEDQFRDMMARIEVLKGALSIALLEPATRFYELVSKSLATIAQWTGNGGPAKAADEAKGLGPKLKDGLKTGVGLYDYYREAFKSYLADLARPGAFAGGTMGKGRAPTDPGRPINVQKPDVPNLFEWAKDKFGRRPIPPGGSAESVNPLTYGGVEFHKLLADDMSGDPITFSSPEVRARIFGAQYTGGQITGGTPPPITQNNTFNVQSADPLAAAAKVHEQQLEAKQNLGDLVRNNKGGAR